MKSLDRLMRKLLAFVEVHSEPGAERARFDAWMHRHAAVVGYRPEVQLGLDFEGARADEDESDADEDVIPPELLEAVTELPRDEYDVPAILDKTFEDLDEIVQFLDATSRLTPDQDDKVRRLTRLLRTKDLAERKVLVFTEFADTARYVESQLRAAGIDGLVRIDSGSKVDRAEVIRRFSPYYNASNSSELAKSGLDEIRVLVSTDVLSEGLNLQDATRLVNYDLHWNPVRLMQRIGRVDRRMSPETEARLAFDHPEAAADRGVVRFWNFLPPDELENILELYEKVAGKTLLISSTLGIEGRKLLRPDDDYDPLREFNATYEGTRTAAEEMHLEYQALLKKHSGLAEQLDALPGSAFSGRRKLAKGARGVFFCYAEFFNRAYNPRTLSQLLYLRDVLRWSARRSDAMVAALVLGALHGESEKSPSYLSAQMPRTISTKPAYSVRFWDKHGYVPPGRDVFELLERQAKFRYASPLPELRGYVELTDFRELHRLKSVRQREASCIITSPPYLNVTSFEEDQWLRLWFLGGPPHPTRNRVSRDDRHELASAYWRMVADFWRTAGYLVASRGHVVVRMAGKRLSADGVVEGLTGCAAVAGRDVSLVNWEKSEIPRRQTDAFRPGSVGVRFEVDAVFEVV